MSMTMTLSSLCSSNPSLKPPPPLLLPPKLSSHTARLCSSSPARIAQPFLSTRVQIQCLRTQFKTHNSIPFSGSKLGFTFGRNPGLGFRLSAENGDGESLVDRAEEEARGQSTMPERFRYLTKEAPDQPVRWPWLIALAFLIYAWRTVLWELSNWKKAIASIFYFIGYLSKLVLALIFHFIGDPITSLIRGIETTLYTIRAFYSGVVAYAPIRELTLIIIFASTVLAIGEATEPDSVRHQPYLLSLTGLIGYLAVRGSISEPFFWTLLIGIFGYSRLVKKRDYVSSALPVAAVLVAIGEPWVRVIVMSSYLALAITQYSRKPLEGKDEGEDGMRERRVPVPLLCAALAIGVRVAAKWAGYRHLTWMIA